MSREVLVLRIFHGLTAAYFIFCLLYLYYSAFVIKFDFVLVIALISLGLEGFVVFILNNGDCPLIFIQRKVNDPVPFFNLFLPKKLAKKAVPFFLVITLLGLFLLAFRFFFRILSKPIY